MFKTLIISRNVNRLSGQARLLNRPNQKNRPMKGRRPGSNLRFFSKSNVAWPIPNR